MEPKTCPHPNCGYTWTPRKEGVKKCPQCANPLWKSPRPKKKRQVIEQHIDIGVFDPDHPAMADEVANVAEYVRAPIEKDSLSDMKAKAEQLMRRLQA